MVSTNRVAVTLQFVPGKDDDLIAWLESLPEKGRNQGIKSLMRAGLNLPIPSANGHASEHELQQLRGKLENLLNELPSYIAHIVEQRLAGISAVEPQVQESGQLTESDIQTRAAKIKKAKW